MKQFLAEFFGTFFLVFAGTGAIIIDQETGGSVTHVGVSLTFGLIVMAMIYAVGRISGAHLNPAVSIALSVAQKFKVRDLPLYIISQVAGAVAASLLLKFLFPQNNLLGATMPLNGEMQSFILEFILTFLLQFVIMSIAFGDNEKSKFAGIVIGSVVGLEALFAGPICGASMNPARSLAPALVSGHLEHLWLYLVATTLGAIAAIPVWKYFNQSSSQA